MQGDANRRFHMTYQHMIVFSTILSFFRALTALASLLLFWDWLKTSNLALWHNILLIKPPISWLPLCVPMLFGGPCCSIGVLHSLWLPLETESCVLSDDKDELLRSRTLQVRSERLLWLDYHCFLWHSRHTPAWECWVDEHELAREPRHLGG